MTSQTLITAPGTTAPPKARAAWYLVGCLPPIRTLSQIKIDSPTFVIGRRPESDLAIASQCVSARHAEILQIGPHLFIRDLGSTNGTFLNRQQVKQPTPIAEGDHIEIANVEFRVELRSAEVWSPRQDLDVLKKTAQAVEILESNWVLSQFNRLMETRGVLPHYQPLYDLRSMDVIGYESLARTPLVGLENPAEMFRTAEMVHQEVELSLICRQKAVEYSQWMPPGTHLFVNTHSHESLDVDVLPSLRQLRREYPDLPIVVEVHEGAIHDPMMTAEFCHRIRDLGMKVAYDDFGAGQSRLLELVKAPPDFLKFDASLIRDVHEANSYQLRMMKMLVDICHDVPIVTVAEGVEKAEEMETCKDLGFDIGQGFFLGRPMPVSAYTVINTDSTTDQPKKLKAENTLRVPRLA
ncbi:EAL domain-containing protein [Planctomicrobium sp. SH664]|uniref:EAL domain-containing protein n=1 Tax=Planctomicrobium sp. SH664 TaxID=3448125 RepID=UPI003F5B5DF5